MHKIDWFVYFRNLQMYTIILSSVFFRANANHKYLQDDGIFRCKYSPQNMIFFHHNSNWFTETQCTFVSYCASIKEIS